MSDIFDRRRAPSAVPPASGTPRRRLHDDPDAAPAAPGAGPAYARFIPREEVHSFAAWSPGSFGAAASAAKPAAPAPLTPASVAAQVQAARQAGYQDGYRDGLVALDGFKQSYAQQLTAPLAQLTEAYRQRLDALESALADQVAGIALALARQVLRSELATRRELVCAVAQEVLAGTLASARQIALHVHPDDHALVATHAGDALAARGARLLPDASVSRGGCVVDTDVGVIDASVEARWRRATEAMGRPSELLVAPADAPSRTPQIT